MYKRNPIIVLYLDRKKKKRNNPLGCRSPHTSDRPIVSTMQSIESVSFNE